MGANLSDFFAFIFNLVIIMYNIDKSERTERDNSQAYRKYDPLIYFL